MFRLSWQIVQTLVIWSTGTPFNAPTCCLIISTISSPTSPWITISSSPWGVLLTLLPVANFPANCLAAFLRSTPNNSRFWICVWCLRFVRSERLMTIYLKEWIYEAFTQGSKKDISYLGLFLLLGFRFSLLSSFLLQLGRIRFELLLLVQRKGTNSTRQSACTLNQHPLP